MQKQRLEFEDMLARKLREQEDALTRQASAALQQKDAGIESLVNATKESLEAEHEANLKSQMELLQTGYNAKYETDYANKLAEEKQKFVSELESKVGILETLAKKLEEMEQALSTSRSFTDGSVKAHRVSAAALALAEKLETSQGAKAEVGALEVCILTLFVSEGDVEGNRGSLLFIRLLPQIMESLHPQSVLFRNLLRLVFQHFRSCKRNSPRSTKRVDRRLSYQLGGSV
jgi:hypothetical protein